MYDSVRLYTSVLQMVHSQLTSHPDKTLGCFGFLDHRGAALRQDWERFGSLWGWEDGESFAGVAREIITKSPVEMDEKEKSWLVPDRLRPLMRAFEDVNGRVNDLCYSSLYDMDVSLDALAPPPEDAGTAYAAPNAVMSDEVA